MINTRNTLALFGALATLGAALGAGVLALPHSLAAQAPNGGPGAAPAAEPVLIELFTSQGCSSCPPADQVAARMAPSRLVVVIARPVTYWDRLGWKDTLAREENTRLQQAYARRGLLGRNGVYTPQAVVNGVYGTVGSREGELRRSVADHGTAGRAAIRIKDLGAEGYAIGLGGHADTPAELLLIGVTREAQVAIGSGENGGRSVTYTNVLRGETVIASWSGGKASHVIDPSQLTIRHANRYALVLREPDGGKVLAARWLT